MAEVYGTFHDGHTLSWSTSPTLYPSAPGSRALPTNRVGSCCDCGGRRLAGNLPPPGRWQDRRRRWQTHLPLLYSMAQAPSPLSTSPHVNEALGSPRCPTSVTDEPSSSPAPTSLSSGTRRHRGGASGLSTAGTSTSSPCRFSASPPLSPYLHRSCCADPFVYRCRARFLRVCQAPAAAIVIGWEFVVRWVPTASSRNSTETCRGCGRHRRERRVPWSGRAPSSLGANTSTLDVSYC
ncbi:hypothetical protein C8R45DRAFT_118872 [Mycena sanguinolenta]|nr:hypothetical protein C8R45DRAFT_118872 [Mycena sanguinolenta]